MAISRAQLAKELEPGLNALFGLEYSRYESEHSEIFEEESSDRAFEEEVMLGGFGSAPTKGEGTAISFDDAQETYTARYQHETIALAFSLTEEAIEDNLYDRLASRYTKALARSMSQTKQIKAAAVLNNAFDTANPVGDGAALCSSAHPSLSGNQRNQLTTAADLNETSLEQMLIDIAGLTDERGLKIAVRGMKLLIPKELQFIAERVINSNLRSGTADNDTNAVKSISPIRMRSSSRRTHRTAASTSIALRLKPVWKATSTPATCGSKPGSVTASVFRTGVACLVRRALRKPLLPRKMKRAAFGSPFFCADI